MRFLGGCVVFKWFAVAVLAAILIPVASTAHAQGYDTGPIPHEATGRYWLPICENPSTNYRCIDVVDGINSGHAQMVRLNRVNVPYCAGTATLGVLTDVATSYIRRNQHLTHLRYTDLALMAWQEAWPCRRY